MKKNHIHFSEHRINVKVKLMQGYSIDVAPVLHVDETARDERERLVVEWMLQQHHCKENNSYM